MKRGSIQCRPALVAVGGLAMTMLLLWAGPSLAEDKFPEQPWGYGTVAERCTVCHSLEEGGAFRVAPNLWNIVGAEKARDRSWYNYSPELISMGGIWTDEDLDHFLTDANAFAPGSTKSIRVTDPEERQQIIEFLNSLHD